MISERAASKQRTARFWGADTKRARSARQRFVAAEIDSTKQLVLSHLAEAHRPKRHAAAQPPSLDRLLGKHGAERLAGSEAQLASHGLRASAHNP